MEQNRATFLRQLGAVRKGRELPLITVRQVHSDLIHCVSEIPQPALTGDGLITRTPGLLLAILTADCLPVILVDTKRRAVGVFHAGWRGTVKRIVEKGVGEMYRCFGTRPGDLKAAIGPGATLDDVFRAATGAGIEPGGTYRDVARTRRTASRLG